VTASGEPVRLIAYSDASGWGGAEQSLSTLLSELAPRFDVTVIGTNREIAARIADARPGSPTVVVPDFSGKFDARSILAHIQAFHRVGADLCHLNLRTPYACQGGIAAALATRTRMVAVEHLPLHSPSDFMRWSRRRLAPRYRAHVSVGHESARLIEAELGLEPGSLLTIHNGVKVVAPTPRHRNATTVVGTVGRLDEQKNQRMLIEAIARLSGVKAVVVGEGPERAELERLAVELGVADRIELLGWSDEPRSLLSTFDVFALPSAYEGFPLVIIEAMLAGLPIVATSVGSVAEAIDDGTHGLLVPPGDVQAFAAAIERLITDPDLRTRLGAAAQARAENEFTAGAMAARYELLYDDVIGR